jgi:hypothetical protein
MKSNYSLLVLICLSIFFFTGCYYDNFTELHPSLGDSGPCDTSKVMTYSSDITSILNNSCGTNNSCHGTSNTSGYDLTTYGGVKATVQNNQLYSSITFDGTVSSMPKGSSSPISSCSISKIKKWIDAGYPNN